MEDQEKTKEKLVNDVTKLRRQLTELKTSRVEPKQLENILQDIALEWRCTFDAIKDSVCLIDTEGAILRCNKAMADLLGKPFSEIIGRRCWELVHGTTKPIKNCPLARVLKSSQRETLTLSLQDRSFNITVDPVLDDAGKVTGAVQVISDITESKQAQEAVKKSEARLRRLTDNMQDMISETDTKGVFLYLSPSHYQALGYRPEELLGRSIYEFLHPDDVSKIKAAIGLGIRMKLSGKGEYRVRHTDGHYVWFESLGKPLLDEKGRVVGGVFSTRDITERKMAEEALSESEEKFRDLAQKVIEAQENERKLVSAEIHDTLLQSMVGIFYWLEVIRPQIKNEEQGKRVDQLADALQEAITSGRNLIGNLRPSLLDTKGLKAALQDFFARNFYEDSPVVDLKIGELPAMGDEFKISLFRIVQEAALNVKMHAHAARIDVVLRKSKGYLYLTVKDDGVGFDPEKVVNDKSTRGHLGLTALKERVALHDGKINIKTVKGKGTEIEIVFPLKKKD